MKIQVHIGGDEFVFSGTEAQVQTLVKAAILVVYGDTEKRYSLVDSLELPVTTLHHLQTYTVVQQPGFPQKHAHTYQAIQPNLYFDDEVAIPRTKPSVSALTALCEATDLSEELIETLFAGCETTRVEGEQISRREVYVDLSGRFAWGFGGKCLGREALKDLRVENTCLWLGTRAFRLMVSADAKAWSRIQTLDISGFAYFLRSLERCNILKRWSA